MKINRRTLLVSGLLGSIAIYAARRGIRYPTLSLEPSRLESTFRDGDTKVEFRGCIKTNRPLDLRAYQPQPSIRISSQNARKLLLTVNNIDATASLDSTSSSTHESINGITRTITISIKANEIVELSWTLPSWSSYTFAAIGDTGGGSELAWCIQRAHDLGAKFLLHLGDFNYTNGDYASAVTLFRNSPIPCYVAIGNHDFHENGLIHDMFTSQIGPLNSVFRVGKTRFLNLDTAANTLPSWSGQRGRLVKQELDKNQTDLHSVVYTHRPLHDPSGDSSHDIGNTNERDWLVDSLNKLNAPTLLSGHIHIFDRSKVFGIDNIIVGQGLGHQDLLTANNDTSKIALGKVSSDGSVHYEFPSLEMPMMSHCHPRVEPVKATLRGDEHSSLIEQIDKACETRN